MVYSSEDKEENLLDSVPKPRVASKELGEFCVLISTKVEGNMEKEPPVPTLISAFLLNPLH